MSDPKPKLACAPNPCPSCPYRKDTPSGVWSEEEYNKLPGYDNPMEYPGLFLCHHSTTADKDMVCRGWLEVHHENIGVRIAMLTKIEMDNYKIPTKVKLFKSGAEACEFGLKNVNKPSAAARKMIDKLREARERKSRVIQ